MRYKNKFGINFFDNELKKNVSLLEKKNELEAQWYDQESAMYLDQFKLDSALMPMDKDFESWFAAFYDGSPVVSPHDRDSVFMQSFPHAANLKMLELGSGNGCLSRFFLRRGIAVYSIEISAGYCQFLKKSFPQSSAIRSCAEILPFKNDSFDVVSTFVALHHFNLELALNEIYRVLKRGGAGIFMEPLCNSELLYKIRQLVPVSDNESPGGGGMRTNELRAQLEKHGFEYKLHEFELMTRLERLPLMTKFQDKFRKIDHFILRKIPLLRNYARTIVIHIRKP